MRTHAWSPHMPGLHHIQVVNRIKMVDNTNVKINRKELEMQRSELFWSLYQVHIQHFFFNCHVIPADWLTEFDSLFQNC